ncbi:MAG: phytoene/squalene synthase family protein [Candidatus Eremiobacterota bacterium]
MAISLKSSYQHCQKITRERARNFYYGIRLLPSARRDALCAIYAFFRYTDDLSDDETAQDRLALLAAWRRALDAGGDSSSPILPAFRHAVERYAIPPRYFEELIQGTEMDQTVSRYPTFQDLYGYCYRVASTVGLVCIHVFGFDRSPEALKMAEERGIAFQLTNILRDIAEDAGRGRIYLPLEDLQRFQVTPEALLAGRPEPGFSDLVQFEVDRTRGYYDRSAPLRQRVDRSSRPALDAMTSIYRGLLDKIQHLGPRVLVRRARLNAAEKLAAAGKSLIGLR